MAIATGRDIDDAVERLRHALPCCDRMQVVLSYITSYCCWNYSRRQPMGAPLSVVFTPGIPLRVTLAGA